MKFNDHGEDIQKMAQKLATIKAENMSNIDLEDILLNGVKSYSDMYASEIVSEYLEVFGPDSWAMSAVDE